MTQVPWTKLRRIPDRACHDREVIRSILAEGFLCTVSIVEDGQPYGLPMMYGLSRDHLLLHGSTASRVLRVLASGAPACITVMLLDGWVLARSLFHHSLNYRSVMLFGRGHPVEDPQERRQALLDLSEHALPGRSASARGPSREELLMTAVIRFPLDQLSAKIRTGDPRDEPEDLDLDHWAGVVPLRVVTLPPQASSDLGSGIAAPPDLEKMLWRTPQLRGP